MEARDIVAPGIVVLIEHRDARVGVVLQQVAAIDRAFGLVVRLPADAPGEMRGIGPERRARGLEELRHLVVVEIFVDDDPGRRAQAGEDEGDIVLLDQPAASARKVLGGE